VVAPLGLARAPLGLARASLAAVVSGSRVREATPKNSLIEAFFVSIF